MAITRVLFHSFFTETAVVARPVVFLDYLQGHVSAPFEPLEDDRFIRNDVTVTRDGGSSARATQESGPLSVLAPPDGVGQYDESVTLSLAEDDQLLDQAAWRVHLGTVDEERYPTVTVDLTRNPDLVSTIAHVDSGDRLVVTGMPDWTPPGDVDDIAQGYEETFDSYQWIWTANTTPGRPWQVGVLDDPNLSRLDTSGAELTAALDTTTTTATVATTSGGALWVDSVNDPAEFPFDVLIGGERMTVTAISGATSPQVFTVTRSVNGIVKAHAVGAPVNVADPLIVAL